MHGYFRYGLLGRFSSILHNVVYLHTPPRDGQNLGVAVVPPMGIGHGHDNLLIFPKGVVKLSINLEEIKIIPMFVFVSLSLRRKPHFERNVLDKHIFYTIMSTHLVMLLKG